MKNWSASKILIIAIQLYSSVASACDCISITGFKKTFDEIKTNQNFYFIKGVVTKKQNHGVSIYLIEKNNKITKDTIIVWGDNGNSCRIGTFENSKINDTLYLIVTKIDIDNLNNSETVNDYMLSNCKVSKMKFSKEILTGNFFEYGKDTSISASQLYSSPTYLHKKKENMIEFYPNPSNGKIAILLNDCKDIEVKILNSIGVEESRSNYEFIDCVIDISHLLKGNYTIILNNKSLNKTYIIKTIKI